MLDKLEDSNGNDAKEEGQGILAIKLKTDKQEDDSPNGQIEEEKLIKHQPKREGNPPPRELKRKSYDSNEALSASEAENNAILPMIEEEKEPEPETVQITVKITREKKVTPLMNS